MTELYRGRQGYQGRQGVIGYQGAAGRGYQGFQGEPGYGEDGAQGFQGADGVGSQGHQGFQGLTGTGNQGFQGLQGAAGSGSQGSQGFQGSPGTGNQGAQGAQGAGGGGGGGLTYSLIYSNSGGNPSSGHFTDNTVNGTGPISDTRLHATTTDGRVLPPMHLYGHDHSSTLSVFAADGSLVGRCSFYSFNQNTGSGATAVYTINGYAISKFTPFVNGNTYTFQFIPLAYRGYTQTDFELTPIATNDLGGLGGFTLSLGTNLSKYVTEPIVAGDVGGAGASNSSGSDGIAGASGSPFDGNTGEPDFTPTHWDGGAGGAPGSGGPPGTSGSGGAGGTQGVFDVNYVSLDKSILYLEVYPSQPGDGGVGGQGGVGGVGGNGGAGSNASDGSNGNPGGQGGQGGDGGQGSNGGQGGEGGDVGVAFVGSHNYISMVVDPADGSPGSAGNDGGPGGTGGDGFSGDMGGGPGGTGVQGTPGTGDGPPGNPGGDITVDVDGNHCVLLPRLTTDVNEALTYTVDGDHCFHGGDVRPTSYRLSLDRYSGERNLNLLGDAAFGWGCGYVAAGTINAWATHGAKTLNSDQIGFGAKYLTTFRGSSYTVAGADIIGQWASNSNSLVFAKFTLVGGSSQDVVKTYRAAYKNSSGTLSSIKALTLVDDDSGSDPSPTLTFSSANVRFNITASISSNWTLIVELYEHRF